MRKITIPLITILAISLFLVGSISAECNLSLPPGQVNMVAQDGSNSYFDITLSNVPGGYAVTNTVYPGWCIDRSVIMPRGETFAVMLYSSCAPPQDFDEYEWDKVNYILNNKPITATAEEIQQVIWNYVNFEGPYTPTLAGALAVVADAEANGSDFVPGPGDIVATLLIPIDNRAQATIIELMIGDEGLTPGFWKNHLNCWTSTGYSPDDLFSDVFGVSITINAGKKDENNSPTLLEALNAKGGINEDKGEYDALARHAVAALLNSAQPDVEYPLSENSIINAVIQAIGNADPMTLKNMLDSFNNLGGGIDAHCNHI